MPSGPVGKFVRELPGILLVLFYIGVLQGLLPTRDKLLGLPICLKKYFTRLGPRRYAIFVMLLTHDKWRSFTTRPIPDSGSSEVMNCLSCDSRDEVDQWADTAGARGGAADVNPAQDHGFMTSRSFADPDGHVWEVMWMDPAVAEGEQPVPETAQS